MQTTQGIVMYSGGKSKTTPGFLGHARFMYRDAQAQPIVEGAGSIVR